MKALLFALLAALAVFNTVGCGKGTPPGYHLHGWFKTLQTLRPGDPVMRAGVEIGYVESIVLDPSRAETRVTMRILSSVVVKTDSTATIISAAPSPGRSCIVLDSGSPGAVAAVEGTILKTIERARAAAATLTLAEQDVIEALLTQDFDTKNSKQHVIRETTSVSQLQSGTYDAFSKSLREEAKQRDQAFKEALDNFLQKNKTAIRIAFPTNAPKSVELISDATVEEIFPSQRGVKPKGWDYFYRRFPDSRGLITVSRVGMDAKGTVAIIYLGQQHQDLDGIGFIRILKREGKKWVRIADGIGGQWRS
jgi:hypothetical protein